MVVDYSAPNIAKEMHVGHLRTTIIGDSLARVLGHLGATVLRQNHLGDWGTQFGMLIQYLDEHPEAQWRHSDLRSGDVDPGASTVSALDGLYRVARAEFEAEPAFADRARARVVALQAGDEATVARWREIVDESELAFREIYGRLGVLLEPGDSAGESVYNQWLPEVVDELSAQPSVALDHINVGGGFASRLEVGDDRLAAGEGAGHAGARQRHQDLAAVAVALAPDQLGLVLAGAGQADRQQRADRELAIGQEAEAGAGEILDQHVHRSAVQPAHGAGAVHIEADGATLIDFAQHFDPSHQHARPPTPGTL